MKFKKVLLLLALYIILFISCGSSRQYVDTDLIRPKRTLQYFIEGILSAFAEKNRSRSHSPPLSGIAKLSALSINAKKTVSDEEIEDSPTQFPIPAQQVSMPTKISLPLLRTEKTSSTSTTITTTSTTVARTTTRTSTAPPTTTNRIDLDTEFFTEMPTTIPNTERSAIDETAETQTAATTDATFTTIIPCPDEVLSTLPAPIELTSSINNEILSKIDPNDTMTIGADARQLPVYQDRPVFRAISGRHTQFFGNPMVLERHQDGQTPHYYDDYDYANANDIVPNKMSSLRGYLPQPLIILPMAIPIPSTEINDAIGGKDISHSRVKMHDSNTHQYTWHSFGNPSVPIVNLHQAHVQYFGRKA